LDVEEGKHKEGERHGYTQFSEGTRLKVSKTARREKVKPGRVNYKDKKKACPPVSNSEWAEGREKEHADQRKLHYGWWTAGKGRVERRPGAA